MGAEGSHRAGEGMVVIVVQEGEQERRTAVQALAERVSGAWLSWSWMDFPVVYLKVGALWVVLPYPKCLAQDHGSIPLRVCPTRPLQALVVYHYLFATPRMQMHRRWRSFCAD